MEKGQYRAIVALHLQGDTDGSVGVQLCPDHLPTAACQQLLQLSLPARGQACLPPHYYLQSSPVTQLPGCTHFHRTIHTTHHCSETQPTKCYTICLDLTCYPSFPHPTGSVSMMHSGRAICSTDHTQLTLHPPHGGTLFSVWGKEEREHTTSQMKPCSPSIAS